MSMRHLGRVLFFALALTACSDDPRPAATPSAAAPGAVKPTAGIIVAMGDSLTAGYGVDETEAYPALLQARLHADGHRWQVINAGISGETSSGARSRLDWVLDRLKPDIVLLTTGANDGLRGIDPKVVEENLLVMVRRLQTRGVVTIIGGMKIAGNLGADYTENFAAVYPAVAAATGARLIPFFLEGVAGDRRYNLSDGIHPNAAGYQRIVEGIYPTVVEAVTTLPPANGT
ncbi:MAG: arylesterase [Desulfosarcinaceae bacterium]